MALEEYKRKRDFKRTAEPAGARPRRKQADASLSFVIQKHAASRLHYDFRLELDGVLKSWAVPKGPSLDPGEKRLAVHVEDHPLEYGGFEGVIPKGQYGGGAVLLWDRGTWSPLDADPAAAYRKGTLKFALEGEKLHGHWMLVRMGGKAAAERQENWLLIKEHDQDAVPQSGNAIVVDQPLSVDSGRSIEAIAADQDRVWQSNRDVVPAGPETAVPARAAGKAAPTKADSKKAVSTKVAVSRVAGARKAAMPDAVRPQLATAADVAPEGPDWLHEIKYDGYRLLAFIDNGKVRLLTRNALDWTAKFPALASRLTTLPVATALIDGELVHLEPDGTTSFAGLQDAISRGRTDDLVFFAFDLLHRDGWDLTGAILEDRKAALAEIVATDAPGMVRYSDHHVDRGPEFLRQACSFELEGIVSKRRDRPHHPGRSSAWIKVKCVNREEFVVIGFTDPDGARHGFGALILGYHDPGGTLRYAGRVGTGYSDKQLTAIRTQLDPLQRSKAPATVPKGVSRKGVHWVEPHLVAEVRFAGWTGDLMIRHGSFQGLREDKSAAEVVHDPALRADTPAAAVLAAPEKPKATRTRIPAQRSKAAAPATPASPAAPDRARDGSVVFEGARLTHADRVLYPDQAITKLDLAQYYAAIRDWALPHLANRPLSLVRCPDGEGKPCFYQKHVGAGVPDTLSRVEIAEESGTETYLVIEDLAGLVSVVQMGVLEIHPWGSTIDKIETPDRVTFDFDPDVGLPWSRVAEAALEMRDALDGIGLQSFAKSTGGKGLHVVVPLTPKLGWDAVKTFTKWVADSFVTRYPDRFTANMAKRARQGRIFIDYLRNGRGATAIGPYSARARPSAPVSAPLSWEEVEQSVTPDHFTVATMPARLAALKADPWAELPTIRQSLSAAVRREAGI